MIIEKGIEIPPKFQKYSPATKLVLEMEIGDSILMKAQELGISNLGLQASVKSYGNTASRLDPGREHEVRKVGDGECRIWRTA